MSTLETVSETHAPYGVTPARATRFAERRVVLHGITWATYKAIQRDIGESRGCRLAYDSGELEIMAPQNEHGGASFGLGHFVVTLVEEFGTDCRPLGNLTCEREDLLKAIEPDECFYIQNRNAIPDFANIDLNVHPPPDLMIEVDITTNSRNKLTICKALGVPEHWRYDGEKLEIRVLKDGRYEERLESPNFPGLPLCEKLPEFVKLEPQGIVAANRKFRAWVRAELKRKN
jgi:Uma2 family endonuclease